ncbi:MAG: phosphoribosylanthranilate isomerase, partial [Rhodothermales bacterium]
MAPKLKICGITRLEDARFCAAAGADYLGFIQHDKSPRYVEPSRAKQIIDWVYGPQAVGVFVNASADAVNRSASEAGFALVQLHGDETPELCAEIELPVIKAVRIQKCWTAGDVRRALIPYAGVADYFLLDTYSETAHGGTGETFAWQAAGGLGEEFKIFLAGGLSALNIGEAVVAVRPFAVDLSSSVESEPGHKDLD